MNDYYPKVHVLIRTQSCSFKMKTDLSKLMSKHTANSLRLQANIASAVLTQMELDCCTGLILNVNMIVMGINPA